MQTTIYIIKTCSGKYHDIMKIYELFCETENLD